MHQLTALIGVLARSPIRHRFATLATLRAIVFIAILTTCSFASGTTLESSQLTAPDGVTQLLFGASTAINGNTAVFGAPAGPGANAPGSVYVFTYDSGTWSLQARIGASDGSIGDGFGTSVAIEGDVLVVGAPGVGGQVSNQGAAYIFTRSAGNWTQQAKLIPDSCGSPQGCSYGLRVAISSGTVAVGSPLQSVGSSNNIGSVFVYTFVDQQWLLQQQLLAADGATGQNFGGGLAIDGDTVVVGAWGDRINGKNLQGSAYIFARSNGMWTQQVKLVAPDGAASDLFGTAVSLYGDTALIGIRGSLLSPAHSGCGYLFTRSDAQWSFQNKLVPSDWVPGDELSSIAIRNGVSVLGSRVKGTAATFVQNVGSWIEKNKLLPSNGFPGDQFGASVSLSGNQILVGAPQQSVGTNSAQGVAYFYILSTDSPDLAPEDDSGISNTDNITKVRSLHFTVSDVAPGSTVDVMRDSTLIATLVADSDSITFNDQSAPDNSIVKYSVRQTLNGVTTSPSVLFVTIDTLGPLPTVSQSNGQPDPTRLQPISFTVTFNEPVFGAITPASVSLAGSTANTSAATINAVSQNGVNTIQVGNALSDGTIVTSLLPNAVQDAAGNPSLASRAIDNTVRLDITSPTVTINQAANQQDPTGSSTINFTVQFSEPVVDFGLPDITFTGSSINQNFLHIQSITGNGTTFNIQVGISGQQSGSVVATIPAGVIHDAAGNANTASTSSDNSIFVDTAPPTVTINQSPTQADPTSSVPIRFQAQFSEPVFGLTTGSVSFSGSTVDVSHARVTISGSGTTYEIAVSNLGPNGGLLFLSLGAGAAHDALGNNSLVSTSSDNGVTYIHGTMDGGFELNNTSGINPYWSSTSTRFGTSLCTITSCGNGNGTAGPRTGNGWIWFDGSDQTTAEQATASQNLTFPTGGIATLNYYLRIGAVSAPSTSVLQVKVDGTVLQTVPEPAVADESYNLRTVDVSAYADGKTHLLTFEYSRPAGATFDNFTIDDVSLSAPQIAARKSPVDFDGDGKTDISIFRPQGASGGAEWWYLRSSDSQAHASQFGTSTDKVVAADFTGDGKTDIAVWRPSTGEWFIVRSEDGSFYAFPFGAAGDIPMPADYDGDGKADAAVFRPSTATWFILRSSDSQVAITTFGAQGDEPVSADYDGDGKADIGVFRPNGASGGAEWWIQRTTLGTLALQFGASTDKAVPGDYTGDGKTDIAFFRPTDGQWFVLRSEDFSYFAFPFGTTGDVPVPGDYDADGKWDAAVFRPSASTWYVNKSSGGTLIQQFATPTDMPVANAYVR